MSTALYVLTVWGLVYVIVDSLIFAPVRIWLATRLSLFLAMGLYCAVCVSFWAGLGLALVIHAGPWWAWTTLFDVALSGFLAMGTVVIARGPWPHFLAGAWERERSIIQDVRDGRDPSGPDGD